MALSILASVVWCQALLLAIAIPSACMLFKGSLVAIKVHGFCLSHGNNSDLMSCFILRCCICRLDFATFKREIERASNAPEMLQQVRSKIQMTYHAVRKV